MARQIWSIIVVSGKMIPAPQFGDHSAVRVGGVLGSAMGIGVEIL